MIPTAEEFLKAECPAYDRNPVEMLTNNDIYYHMRQFAKLHVKAAIKEVLESIPCLGSSSDIATYEEVEEAVLNAYPETLIK